MDNRVVLILHHGVTKLLQMYRRCSRIPEEHPCEAFDGEKEGVSIACTLLYYYKSHKCYSEATIHGRLCPKDAYCWLFIVVFFRLWIRIEDCLCDEKELRGKQLILVSERHFIVILPGIFVVLSMPLRWHQALNMF